MRNRWISYLCLASASVLCATTSWSGGISEYPDWLFPIGSPANVPTSWDSSHVLSVQRSHVHYTQAQVNDLFDAPDWFPELHGPMPEVVAHGHKPNIYACGFCHTPTGQGRPENASLAALPASYITRQLEELRSGARRQVGPDSYRPIRGMVELASHLSDADIKAAAEYFSRQTLRPRVQVKEAKNIPCVEPALWIYLTIMSCERAALGSRIIELAPSEERHELRDDSMVYVAYVPMGSINRGRALSHASDSTHACTTCHGEGLRGTDLAPPLAGRSPTSLLRQLLAFQHHTREGERAVLMQPVVQNMSLNDMIDAVAYAAALTP
jgi:cytochrome c553